MSEMTRDEAAEVLGVSATAPASEVAEAWQARDEALAHRIDSAPTPVLKAKFERSRARLAQARAALEASAPAAAPAPRSRSGSPLSQTMLQDLPSAGPLGSDSPAFDSAAQQAIALEPGAKLGQRYEVRRLVGAGGMGAVYAAWDEMRQEEIALKVLLPELLQKAEARERFLQEARLASKLSHPNIVNVFDVQRDGEFHFMTMELLEGETLREAMQERSTRGENWSPKEVVRIAVAVSAALEEAHRFTVHRDVKPENIFMCEDGSVKLMDFGIARAMSGSVLTRVGAALGTAYYMAPEQLQSAGSADGRADQYSVGVTLYELLTGKIAAGRFSALSEARPDLPAGLASAVDRALAADPDARFPSMKDFAAALRASRKAKRKKSRSATSLPRPPAAIIGGLVGLLVIGLLAVVLLSNRGPSPRATALELQSTLSIVGNRLTEEREAAAEAVEANERRLERLQDEARSGRTSSARRAAKTAAKAQLAASRIAEAAKEELDARVLASEGYVSLESKSALGESYARERKWSKAVEVLSAARAQGDLLVAEASALAARRDWELFCAVNELEARQDALAAAYAGIETAQVQAEAEAGAEAGTEAEAEAAGIRAAFESAAALFRAARDKAEAQLGDEAEVPATPVRRSKPASTGSAAAPSSAPAATPAPTASAPADPLAGLRSSCSGGDGSACSSVAAAYRGGRGVGRNLGKAAEYYRKACDLGDGGGCFGLAFLTEAGYGVTKDPVRASELYGKACKLGRSDACNR